MAVRAACFALAATWLLAGVAAAPPCAIIVAFGADPTTSAVVSFSSNVSAPATVTISPPVNGVTSFAATSHDNSYANAWGVRFVYRAALAGLAPETTYTYTVTVGAESAAPLTFTTLSADPAVVPVVVYWGDLGRDGGGQAFPALEAEAARTAARAAGAGSVGIQAGDFAYGVFGDAEAMSRMKEVHHFNRHHRPLAITTPPSPPRRLG